MDFLDGQMELEEPNGEDENGWYLDSVYNNEQECEQLSPFDDISSSKVLKIHQAKPEIRLYQLKRLLLSIQSDQHLVDGSFIL